MQHLIGFCSVDQEPQFREALARHFPAVDQIHVEADTGRFSDWLAISRAIEHCKQTKAALVIPSIPSRNVPLLKKLDEARQSGVMILPLSIILTINESLSKAVASATRWVARQSKSQRQTAQTKPPSEKLGKNLDQIRANAGAAKKAKAKLASEAVWLKIHGYLGNDYTISEITERLNNEGLTTRRGGKFTFGQVVRVIQSRWPDYTVKAAKKGGANA